MSNSWAHWTLALMAFGYLLIVVGVLSAVAGFMCLLGGCQ